jgi:hypothetical protein
LRREQAAHSDLSSESMPVPRRSPRRAGASPGSGSRT